MRTDNPIRMDDIAILDFVDASCSSRVFGRLSGVWELENIMNYRRFVDVSRDWGAQMSMETFGACYYHADDFSKQLLLQRERI